MGDTGADVGIGVFAGILRHKRGHIADEGFVGGGIAVRSGEGADGAGFREAGFHGGDDVRLELDDFRCRLRANARDSRRAGRGVVVFESLQLHRGGIRSREHLAGGGVEFVEVGGAGETWSIATCGVCAASREKPLG